MIRGIPISQLEPHPETSNRMSAACLTKLTRHIASTGRYEPLIVRPHPRAPGKYQVINGHHRLRVLKAIGHKRAKCVVWEMDDDQARLYLATLNRLSGADIPERRAALIAGLLKSANLEELSEQLPDDKKQIEMIRTVAHTEPDGLAALRDARAKRIHGNVILDFIVTQGDAKIINFALDRIVEESRGRLSRGRALARLARLYVKRISLRLGHLQSAA